MEQLTMPFIAYPATPDFFKFRAEVLKGFGLPIVGTRKFVGTVKLHGTNITIVVNKVNGKPDFQFQSRNKIITKAAGDDNAGAAGFLSTVPLTELVNEILRIRGVETFDEIYIAGEWAGTGIQPKVALSHLKKFFAIFNIRVDGHWVDIRQYKTVDLPAFRIYNIASFETYEVATDLHNDVECSEVYDIMKARTLDVAENCPVGAQILLQDGEQVSVKARAALSRAGEGLVWTMVPTSYDDTALFNFKTKGEQFSAVNPSRGSKSKAGSVPGVQEKTEEFVDYALGERRLEQGIEYLQEMDKDPNAMSSLGEFVKWVSLDLLKEEGWRLKEKVEKGPSLREQGVTDKQVNTIVTGRAKAWFLKRRETASLG